MTRRPDWLTFRRFAAFTMGLTTALIMLGIYTAATGSGLACSQQWPLCDGGVLPQTVPSFIEWFHRLVAMVTGFFILGTAAWSWRAPVGRRTQVAATAALVLLPLQVSIGAVTVTLNGALPGGYSTPTQAAHLLAALAIFTALVLATLFAYRGHLRTGPLVRTRRALVAALVLLPLATVFSRLPLLVPYAPPAQAAFIGLSLGAFAALVAALVWLAGTDVRRLRVPVVLSLSGLFLTMLLGRDLVFYDAQARAVNGVVLAGTVALVAAVTWLVYARGETTTRSGRPTSGN